MNADDFNRLLESAIRRPLTPEEQARLRAHLAEDPSAAAAWEEETALSALLDGLPDAPLSSNFTARVLQETHRTDVKARRLSWRRRWPWPARAGLSWAAASAVLVLLGLGYEHYRSVRRENMARALTRIAAGLDTPSEIVALAPDELWENFDAINRLPQPADQELLAVLKEVAMK